ncbi:MAG: ATP phosphoribosyltransferase regulatory subunit [Andreesenia angusta]|nr:ATP phosphoribosyltransferase regulatory subunit [Andreesenia angusta]
MIGFETPEGVSDELFREYRIKEDVLKRINNVFKSYGYKRVATPTIEYYEVFSSIKSTVLKDEMFKLIDNSGEILTLRPDATIPIARIVAKNYKKEKGNYKIFYSNQVFKMKSESKRERTQTGIEYFGNPNAEADGEVIVNAIEALKNCNVEFKIEIGNAGYYKGLLDEIDIDDSIKEILKNLIEYKNFVELKSYVNSLNLDNRIKNAIIEMPNLYGEYSEVLKRAEEYSINSRMKKSLEELNKIYEFIEDYGYSEYISIDLGIINDLDYYTGVVFKGYLANYGDSILSGGRYDNLTEYYGESIPATGFAISVDDLISGIESQRDFKEEEYYSVDYRVNYKEEDRKKAIEKAKELRKKNFVVELQKIDEFSNLDSDYVKNIINI